MNEKIVQLLENYKDGVPVKLKRESLLWLSACTVLVVAISAMIVKLVKKL